MRINRATKIMPKQPEGGWLLYTKYIKSARVAIVPPVGKEPDSVPSSFAAPSPSSPAASENSQSPSSFIFSKKAKREAKESTIIEALQHSVQGRRDKTRAFVDELHFWQKEQYVDAYYNAKVMYDELKKIIPLSFGYETFKKYYNNTI